MKKTVRGLTPPIILRMLRTHRDQLRMYGVKKIGLFGSFLKKNTHPKSDLDFLVTFTQPTFDNYMELKFWLEKLFRKKVDLVMEGSLKPALRYVRKEALYAE